VLPASELDAGLEPPLEQAGAMATASAASVENVESGQTRTAWAIESGTSARLARFRDPQGDRKGLGLASHALSR